MSTPIIYVSPTNTAMKYGALSGLASFALFIILWSAGKNPLGPWCYLGWPIPIIFTIFAVRDHRDKDLDGYITYGRGFGTGMLVSMFSGFLFAVLLFAFITFIGHTIPQMQIDLFYANMEKTRSLLSEETYESVMQKFEESKDNFTPGNIAVSSFETTIMGGLLISLIIAAIYRKKPLPLDTADTPESNPS